MLADGALTQELNAWVTVNRRYAEAIEKQKWVPEVQMGATHAEGGDSAQDLLSLFLAKTARDLNLDMTIKASNPQ